MLAGKQFFFIQNENNRRIAAEAEKKFGLRGKGVQHEWIQKSLHGVWGRAILLWGDGGDHHLSYYFEKQSGFGLKIGVDAHPDMGGGREPDCTNHFALSAEENHHVVVYVPHWRGYQAQELTGANRGYSHRHISIDFDFVDGFPCAERFSCGSGSLGALLEVVGMSIDENLFRVDMGGLKANPTNAEFEGGLRAYLAVLDLLEKRW